MADLGDLALPQPVAAPRFSLPEGNATAARLEPKDAQADTRLVRNSLPQWIEPLPPAELAVRRPALIQTAQTTPPPALFAVPELPAEVVETVAPVVEQPPMVSAAPPAKPTQSAEAKELEPPAPLQLAALAPQNLQPVAAVRPAAVTLAPPAPTVPTTILPVQVAREPGDYRRACRAGAQVQR